MMMKAVRFICIGIALSRGVPPANAVESSKVAPPDDRYRITDQERAACSNDAIIYCSGTYPDEDKLLVCMKLNHANLSSECRLIFDQGLRRRHL